MKRKLIAMLLLPVLLVGMLPLGVLAAGSKNPFTDVKEGSFYADAVLWAVEHGITNGTDAKHFSPEAQCTRAQVVTFLWRALGEAGSSGRCPFTDVPATAYYYNAVLWAAENGVTTGTSATEFSPEDVVTRAQFVTFLWRALGKPSATATEGFSDVAANQYYYNAVLWAAETGVTKGTDVGRFSPDQSCLRGQTVTFLYRALRDELPEEPTTPTEPIKPTEPDPTPTEPEPPMESATETATTSRTIQPSFSGDSAYWQFSIRLKNSSDKTVSLTKVTVQNLCGGREVGSLFNVDMDELYKYFDHLTAAPDETIVWSDGHPLTYLFNGRRYTLELTDSAGNTFVRTYFLTLGYEGCETPDAAPLGQTAAEQTVLRQPDDAWKYEVWFRNDTDKTQHLVRIEWQNRMGGNPAGAPYIIEGDTLKDRQIPFYLAPGQIGNFADGHPWVDYMDSRVLTIVYADDDGTEYPVSFPLLLSSAQYHPELEKRYPDYSADNGKDCGALRHDADFSMKVAEGVWWVPANTLGGSRYTNAQIQALLIDTPEQKQAKIGTLYEALQLYRIGGFYGSDDNAFLKENGILWEHHKPGYDAVRTNNGCCASCADWLSYILKDDYDEVGFISTMQAVGEGHVFNYIKQDGWYYFVDLTIWHADDSANADESGKWTDYEHSNSVHGNIHRASSLEAFAQYLVDADITAPDFVYTYCTENTSAISSEPTPEGKQCIFPDDAVVNIVYINPNGTLTYTTAPAPVKTNDWSRNEDFAFASMQFE